DRAGQAAGRRGPVRPDPGGGIDHDRRGRPGGRARSEGAAETRGTARARFRGRKAASAAVGRVSGWFKVQSSKFKACLFAIVFRQDHRMNADGIKMTDAPMQLKVEPRHETRLYDTSAMRELYRAAC